MEKVTHVGFHFRVWINTKEQKVVVDTLLFDINDIVDTYWCTTRGMLTWNLNKRDCEYDELYIISGTFNYDWFEQTNYKAVDDMFSEAIKDYFFDAWKKSKRPTDYELEAWLERKIFEVKGNGQSLHCNYR